MFYTIYQITNLINEKIYIGYHKTVDINDGYMGSGKIITRAITKYGKENFKKEILFIFDNDAAMKAKEKELVNEEFVINQNTYNLVCGGRGGFDYINRHGLNDRTGMIHSSESRSKMASIPTEENRLKCSLRMMKNKLNPNVSKTGKDHPASGSKNDEHRKKISESLLGCGGENHHLTGITKKQVTCPHCNKQGGINVMNRWHFENCKLK